MIDRAPAELALRLVEGRAGARNLITSERIQKLGLSLAGFPNYIHKGRIQILGQSEFDYLAQLSDADRASAWAQLNKEEVSGVLITKNLEPPPELLEFSVREAVPVICTHCPSSRAIRLLTDFLEEELAPSVIIHGVMLRLYGRGVLILGESGIGKSESALDLVARGHTLIADDAVTVMRNGNALKGSAPNLTRGFLEIRGLGILNVRDLFGVSAVGEQNEIELCIELQKLKEYTDFERIGLETAKHELLDLSLPKFILPVTSGRNLATLIETATKIHLLRREGKDSTRSMIDAHALMVGNPRP